MLPDRRFKKRKGKRLPHRLPSFETDYVEQSVTKLNSESHSKLIFFTISERPCRIFTQSLKVVNTKNVEDEKNLFIHRFVEVCGTAEPAKIQRLLDISYQAAKNYLQGRLPDSYVLRTIAERTPYPINWLLTGKGEKLVSNSATKDTPLSANQIRDLIRSECVEVINELLGSRESTQQKVVVLQSASLKSEKVKEPAIPRERKT